MAELKYAFYIKERGKVQNQLVKSEKSMAVILPASSKDQVSKVVLGNCSYFSSVLEERKILSGGEEEYYLGLSVCLL